MAVLIFDDEQSDVHDDDENVDAEELPHDARRALLPVDRTSGGSIRCSTDDVERFPDIEARKYELLERETGHLNLLDVLVSISESCLLRSIVSAEKDDYGGNVEYDSVDDDHPFDELEKLLIFLAEHHV